LQSLLIFLCRLGLEFSNWKYYRNLHFCSSYRIHIDYWVLKSQCSQSKFAQISIFLSPSDSIQNG
jgi:hypothetical protein